MGNVEFNDVDDFLGHSGSSGGGGGRFMKNWKKEGSLRTFLHTRRLPMGSWGHNFPTLVSFTDRDSDEQVRAFWGRTHVCWEDESFLKVQYRRDENGNLEETDPPAKCGGCRLIDIVYRMIAAGKLDWTQPVFRFEGATDEKNNLVVHAGGLCGMFGGNNLSKQQIGFLKSKGIRPSEAWKENFHAKLEYVFAIVDVDNVEEGVQITRETGALGNKVKKVIRDMRRSKGEEEGNPMLNPFCIEWRYDKNANINDKYDASPIEKIKMTPEIEKLIRSDPPNIGHMIRPFNQKKLREFFEQYAVVELPWKEIFNVPVLVSGDDDDEFPPPDEKPAETGQRGPVNGPSGRRMQESPPPAQAAANLIPCDKCGNPMREDEAKCSKCGAVYTFDDAPAPPPKAPGKVLGDKPPFGRF